MSALGIAALALTAVWMAVVSVGLVVTIRQVGLLTLRYERTEQAREMDGLSIGSAVPADVAPLLPAGGESRSYLLVLEADCGPCRDLVDELGEQDITEPVVALIAGDSQRAQAVASRLPDTVEAVLGDPATIALGSLDLQTTPFMFIVEGGAIAGKNGPRNAQHFRALLDEDAARPHSHNGRPLEVTHVD
jgi:hypothetical protein